MNPVLTASQGLRWNGVSRQVLFRGDEGTPKPPASGTDSFDVKPKADQPKADYQERVKLLSTLLKEKQFEEALPLLTTLLKEYEADPALGPNHSATISIVDGLVGSLVNLNRFAEAEPYQVRKLEWATQTDEGKQGNPFGTSLIEDQQRMFMIYQEQKKYTEAQSMLNASLANLKAELGPLYDNPRDMGLWDALRAAEGGSAYMRKTGLLFTVGHLHRQQGELYAAQGQSEKAKQEYHKAIEFFGRLNANSVSVLENLLELPQVKASVSARLTYMDQACEIEAYGLRNNYGNYYNDNPPLAIKIMDLAALYEATGNKEKASGWYDLAVSMYSYMIFSSAKAEYRPKLVEAYEGVARTSSDPEKAKTSQEFADFVRKKS